MILKELKKTPKRFDTSLIKKLGIIGYDVDNCYPNRIESVLAASPTGTAVIERLTKFIYGQGAVGAVGDGVRFYSYKANKTQTIDNIIKLISRDLALYRSFALHVSYNVLGQVSAINHVPFKNVRICRDEERNITRYADFWNWDGSVNNGKNYKVARENISYYNPFNPDNAINEIVEAGNIHNYKGQLLYVAPGDDYPLSRIDSVLDCLSTDEGLANIILRAARTGSWGANIIQAHIDTSGMTEGQKKEEKEYWENVGQSIYDTIGDSNSFKTIMIPMFQDSDKHVELKVTPLENVHSFMNAFTLSNEYVEDKIYSAVSQEAFLRIKKGSVGFSSEIISDAFNYYNSYVKDEHILIESTFKMIYGDLFSDYAVKPLSQAATTEQI